MGEGGWEGGSRGRLYGDMCMHMADLLYCATETNGVLSGSGPEIERVMSCALIFKAFIQK